MPHSRCGSSVNLVVVIFILIGWINFTSALSCTPSSPCKNGARCVQGSRIGESYCECPSTHVGEYCQYTNPCNTLGRCEHGGSCRVVMPKNPKVGAPTFACDCPVGYESSFCELEVPNACQATPCKNGVCRLKTLDTYVCNCSPGHRGTNCEHVDHCLVNGTSPCKNNAQCIGNDAKPPWYKCICDPGFTGQVCRTDINECEDPTSCIHGTCTNTYGSYRCKCHEGFTGQRCDTKFIPCQPSLCQNGGTCKRTGNLSYECSCPKGFTGPLCAENINDCKHHHCLNNGKCVDGINSYTCQCPATFTGEFCQTDIDECALRPQICQHGATCKNTIGGYSCICVNGWTGSECSENIDDCWQGPCMNGATCHDRVGSFYCDCTGTGRTGLLCHLVDACASNPCFEGAICETSPIDGSYLCSCPSGYKGTNCTEDIDECLEDNGPCEHNGSCVNLAGSYSCRCLSGFFGNRCEINIDECASSPCQNDGTCLDERGGFRCLCMPGFTGPQCAENMDECRSNPCLNGECIDQINSFKCRCRGGYTGHRCEQRPNPRCGQGDYRNGFTDENWPCMNGGICRNNNHTSYDCDCSSSDYEGKHCEKPKRFYCKPNPCHNGKCIEGVNSFQCQCDAGFTGHVCQTRINLCANNPCLFGGTCEMIYAGFKCTCPPGTRGKLCEENLNECATNPCHNGKCIDGVNFYECQCDPGYAGQHCSIDINECASNPCANGGHCIDLVNGFKCQCPTGYFDSRCLSDFDECASNPCFHGHCEDEVSNYICHCDEGYKGKQCDLEINECDSNPCQHGSTCKDQFNSYECTCLPGYSGINCEINIDECQSMPCKNKGSCVDLQNGYKCICDAGFTGQDCSTLLDPCKGDKCKHGSCKPSPNFLDFSCSCKLGYTGRYCEQDINECAISSPCRNGGTCLNTNGSYTCQCVKGYEDRDCTTNTDDCAISPCINGGTCFDLVDDYKCICVDGFIGRHCDVDKNDCESSPCVNGKCTDYVNSYSCTCSPGFSGTNCNINDQDCTESSCLNGGTCIDLVNNYTCQCRFGYTGLNCQYEKKICDSSPCLNSGTCQEHGPESFRCHCPYGYTGDRCEEFVDWCSTSPCENGICEQTENKFKCKCDPGWVGKVCDVDQVSCHVASLRKGVPLNQLCNGGTCEDIGKEHRCICKEGSGFTGSYCQIEVNECDSSPCRYGGTCIHINGSYSCQCPKGYEGRDCSTNTDDCKPSPCQNGGICHDGVDSFVCSCVHGTYGMLCEINNNDCFDGACYHGGTCIDKINGFECKCAAGYTGPKCEGDVNECLSNPCSSPGTLDCVQLINDYRCDCKPGYGGHLCSQKIDLCFNNVCQNGGICSVKSTGSGKYRTDNVICTCSNTYHGKFCQSTGSPCEHSPCRNGGTCFVKGGDAMCKCPSGTGMEYCQVDYRTDCSLDPCLHNGRCESLPGGGYVCKCSPLRSGKNCERYDPEGHKYDTFILDLEQAKKKCVNNNCSVKAKDLHCDEECNNYACDFDGGDCSLGLNPWKNCTASKCHLTFANGICDPQCNTLECLVDGRDCEPKLKQCNPVDNMFCLRHYKDGHCDQGCNNAECDWDGMDCEMKPPELVAGVMSIVVRNLDVQSLLNNKSAFLRYLGHQLRTTVRIKQSPLGNLMVYPWDVSIDPASILSSGSDPTQMFNNGATGVLVYLEIDNRKCSTSNDTNCFQSAFEAADFLAASAQRHTLESDFDIIQVRGLSNSMPSDEDANAPWIAYVLIGLLTVIMLALLFGVLVSSRRKTARGVLWFPEGFLRSATESNHHRRSRRRGPDGQEMRHLSKIHPLEADFDSGHGMGYYDGITDVTSQYSDDSDRPPSKRMRSDGGYASDHTICTNTDYDEIDPRPWTQQHLEAADVRHPDLLALTPPEVQKCNFDVDVRGPCGLTPLMVASLKGGGLDPGDEEDEDATAAVIADLVAQGAQLNATMDKTGETSLHLAARYARADAAKRLLDAGADANAIDHTGRTPLHAAIAADAMGVFQILLRNRATNLNAKMHDGTTPLVLAARLAIEGMVDNLITAQADLNSADNSGKTALHWSAAVNNVEALLSLLKNGANRDAQDERDETPLFLAAREGSFNTCRFLLDHMANRDIADHMDRLPRDIAAERLHHDIVRLLDEHTPRPSAVQNLQQQQQQANNLSNMNNNVNSPPSQVMADNFNTGSHNASGPPQPKPKKRTIKPEQYSDTDKLPKPPRRPSNRKKKSSDSLLHGGVTNQAMDTSPMSSESNTMSPPDMQMMHNNMFNVPVNSMAISQPNLSSLVEPHNNVHNNYGTLQINKAPPPYEDCFNNKAVSFHNLHFANNSYMANVNNANMLGGSQQQQQQQQQSQQYLQQNSPFPTSPQSTTSQFTASSPSTMSYAGSPPQVTSPSKRPSLPTSPTHMAALRAATQQKLLSASTNNAFDYSPNGANMASTNQFYSNNTISHYPTPPSQHSDSSSSSPQHTHGPDSYPTPSPESPGQWSSSSPHSTSDWSEGIHSPPGAAQVMYNPQMQVQHPHNSSRGPEGIYI